MLSSDYNVLRSTVIAMNNFIHCTIAKLQWRSQPKNLAVQKCLILGK